METQIMTAHFENALDREHCRLDWHKACEASRFGGSAHGKQLAAGAWALHWGEKIDSLLLEPLVIEDDERCEMADLEAAENELIVQTDLVKDYANVIKRAVDKLSADCSDMNTADTIINAALDILESAK
jgi:hypothetical protein